MKIILILLLFMLYACNSRSSQPESPLPFIPKVEIKQLPSQKQNKTKKQLCKSPAVFSYTVAIARDEERDIDKFKEIVRMYVAQNKDTISNDDLVSMLRTVDIIYNSSMEPQQIYDIVYIDCMTNSEIIIQ